MNFCKTSPCNNCPYRTDAPLKLWHKSEFLKVALNEDVLLGHIFLCHKKDGHICIGYLIKQLHADLPNIKLRMLLSTANVSSEYLDKLSCKVPLYNSPVEMIKANYPEILKRTHMKIKLKGEFSSQRVWLNEKELTPERSLLVRNHSITGFGWGYGGSGPSQLALAICLELFKEEPRFLFDYQKFKFDYISELPRTDFEVEWDISKEYFNNMLI